MTITTDTSFRETLGRAPGVLRIVPEFDGPVIRPARAFGDRDAARVMVICPHPDDETLATGVLLQQAVAHGADIRVICLTDGERNPIPQWLFERSLSRERWARRRRQEARDAFATLGIPDECVEFWALPDQKLRSIVYEMTRQLQEAVERFRPTLLVAPSIHDLHEDHVAAGIAAASASGRDAIEYLAYMVHGEPVANPTLVVEAGEEAVRRKFAALERHTSQLIVSRPRLQAICNREEAFRDREADLALPPTRFRAARRLWRVLFERDAASTPEAALTPAAGTAAPRWSL